MAVLIVALVTAGNDYSKELQFRALEKTSEEGNRSMVLRDGMSQLVRGGEAGKAEPFYLFVSKKHKKCISSCVRGLLGFFKVEICRAGKRRGEERRGSSLKEFEHAYRVMP